MPVAATNKGALIGSAAAFAGLMLTGFAGFLLLALGASAGLGPVDPESTLGPAGVSIVASLVVLGGYRLARNAPTNIRVAIGAVAGIPSLIILALACFQAAFVVCEPLYRENRAEVLEVQWRVHSQLPDRATFQIPGGEPYWLTLRKQEGLIEHLKQGGRDHVKLSVTKLVDRKGRVTRFFLKDLDGFKLKRQFYGGQYLPGSTLLALKNKGASK